ncbi:MAG: MarR family transcriptional regulator [Lactococcus lactis]|jgi:AcrR family transcriptional regulator|nr:MarR family transcriptional regulator [Lactococcus lactis]
MTSAKKEAIIRTLLNISAENGKLTIEEISKRSNIPRSTINRNFKNGINEMVETLYLSVVHEINYQLLEYNPLDMTLEIFSDIVLPILWNHRNEAQVLFTSNLPFQLIKPVSGIVWDWAKEYFENLVQIHGLSPYFSSLELLQYFNAQLTSIFILWLGVRIPMEVEVFKQKFLFIMNSSMKNLIYFDIN